MLQLALPAENGLGGAWYQDDGDGYGPWCFEHYRVEQVSGDQVRVVVHREGERPPEKRKLRVVGRSVDRVEVDGATLGGPGPFPLPADAREVTLCLTPKDRQAQE